MELWRMGAVELAGLLARREVSAREAVTAHLERIAALDPGLAAFVTVASEKALDDAARLDAGGAATGPLHGLPVSIKDLTDTAGIRTTYGSAVFAGHVPAQSDIVVDRIERAGGIVIGKTNSPEFGFGAVCTNAILGPTRNPYDPRLTSGGSSGGAAVAVATGMAPLSHGTDFGGSVRTPAGFCGIASLRPTPGLVPQPGRVIGWDTLVTHGSMARSVSDCALLLDAMAGPDPRDPTSLSGLGLPGAGEDGPADAVRIAATPDFGGVAPVSAAVRGLFDEAVAAVERGVGPVARTSPDCTGALTTFRTLRAAQVRHVYGPLDEAHGDRLSPTLRWNVAAGQGLTAEAYLAAQAARTRLYRTFVSAFERFDVLMVPAAALQPWANEDGEVMAIDGQAMETVVDYLAVTFIVSLVGFPVLTLPVPSDRNGIPFGVQFVGRPGSDRLLAAFGERLERELGFRHRWPNP